MESVQKFGPNVFGFQLATGERRWYIVGCYLAPDDTSTIESVVVTLKERPWGAKLLVAGYFNVKLSDLEGGGNRDGANYRSFGGYFGPLPPAWRSWWRDGRTWSMVRAGREVRSRMAYILGMDRRLFWNLSVQDPRHKLDH